MNFPSLKLLLTLVLLGFTVLLFQTNSFAQVPNEQSDKSIKIRTQKVGNSEVGLGAENAKTEASSNQATDNSYADAMTVESKASRSKSANRRSKAEQTQKFVRKEVVHEQALQLKLKKEMRKKELDKVISENREKAKSARQKVESTKVQLKLDNQKGIIDDATYAHKQAIIKAAEAAILKLEQNIQKAELIKSTIK